MNRSIPCIIIDDDVSAIDTLRAHITEFPRLSLNKTFTKPVAAYNEIILEERSQLIFMDIDMPVLSGLSLADNLKGEPHNIIFTTSYPEYALEAFKVRAKHYLLKPYNLSEFAKVVNDVLKECYGGHNLVSESDVEFYFRTFGERSKIIKVLKADIIYIQGSNNHIHLYTPTENFSIYMTIKEMEEKLKDNPGFFRVHKSYIINSGFVRRIVGNKIDLGKYEVLMAARYKAAFCNYVDAHLLLSKRN